MKFCLYITGPFDLWLPFIIVFSHSKYCFYNTMKTTIISACQSEPIVRQNFILKKHTAYCRGIIPYIYLRVPECLSLRPNCLPPPSPASECVPLWNQKGGHHWGGANSEHWRESLALCTLRKCFGKNRSKLTETIKETVSTVS